LSASAREVRSAGPVLPRRAGGLRPKAALLALCLLAAGCTPGVDRARARADKAYEANAYAEAEAAYGRVLALDPAQTEARFFRAVCRQLLGDYPGAVADLDTVVREAPDAYKAFLNRGHCFYALGRYAEARDDYARVLDLEPGYGLALNPLAHMHFYLGDTALACRTLARARDAMAAREVDAALKAACAEH
jgi:tetratricopeptide (TPR) repeat protein